MKEAISDCIASYRELLETLAGWAHLEGSDGVQAEPPLSEQTINVITDHLEALLTILVEHPDMTLEALQFCGAM